MYDSQYWKISEVKPSTQLELISVSEVTESITVPYPLLLCLERILDSTVGITPHGSLEMERVRMEGGFLCKETEMTLD